MFEKRREGKLLEQIANVNEDLQRKLSKSERKLKDINAFLSFLSESVCKGKQICGIKKIRRYDQDVYVGYVLEHKFEIEQSYDSDLIRYDFAKGTTRKN